MTSTTAAPSDGKISTDSTFSLNLGLGNEVAVTLTAAATSSNTNRNDLVVDLNSSLATAGVPGSVVAALDASNRLTFSTTTTTLGVAALELTAADYDPQGPSSTDPIVTELGFREHHFTFDSLANHAFFEGATIDAALSLTATDIDGDTNVGFLGVAIDSGAGTSTADFSLQLKSVASQTPGGRVGLFELFEALALDITDVVDVPTLGGALNVSLPLTTTILGEALTTNPEVVISWPDLGVGAASVTLLDGSELEPFENLSSADFTSALSGVGDYLSDLESFSAYGMEIPGLNKSLGELGGFSERFVQFVIEFQNNPAGALDDLEATLEASLGLSDENLDLSLVENGNVIRADLTFVLDFMEQIPLAVDFPFATLGNPETIELLIGLSGSALLNVDFDVDFQLSFGIDISNALSLVPFIYETSHLNVDAEVNTQNIDFNANIGPFGLFIRGGELLIDADGNDLTRDQAMLDISLSDNNPGTTEGKISLADIGLEHASASLTGQLNLVLPMYFPLLSDSIGSLELHIGDFSDVEGTTTLVLPELQQEDDEDDEEDGDPGTLDNLTAILNGLDAWFEIAIDAFNGKVGSFDLPFVGKDLHKVADFLEEVHQDVVSQITDRFEETEGNTGAAPQTALFLAVGPDGLNILKDRNGSGSVTIDDIEFANTDLDQDAKVDQVEIFMDLGQNSHGPQYAHRLRHRPARTWIGCRGGLGDFGGVPMEPGLRREQPAWFLHPHGRRG